MNIRPLFFAKKNLYALCISCLSTAGRQIIGKIVGSVCLLILAFIFALHLKIPFLTPSGVEEKLYALQASQNFFNAGFGATHGLSNYSTRNEAPPFVYTHLVDLPANVIYLSEKLGAGIQGAKVFFIAFTFLGVLLLGLVLTRIVPFGWGMLFLTLFAINPDIFALYDNLHWSLSIFSFSASLLLMLWQVRTVSRVPMYLYIVNVVFTTLFSWFLSFQLFIFTITLALVNPKNKCLRALGVYVSLVLVCCVTAKFFWNASYIGTSNELKELLLTISNRIIGRPGNEDLQKFFNSNGIVLWGSPAQTPWLLLKYFKQLFINLIHLIWPGVVLVCIAAVVHPSRMRKIFRDYYLEISVLFASSVGLVSWSIFFPAHAGGYINPIFNSWVRILPFIVLIFLLDKGLLKYPQVYIFKNRTAFMLTMMKSTLLLYTVFSLGISLVYYASDDLHFYSGNRSEYRGPPKAVIDLISNHSAYTNVSVIFLGYFAKSATLAGRCTPEAAIKHSPYYCYNLFEKLDNSDVLTRLTQPDFFVFNSMYLSGNTSWSDPSELQKFHEILDKSYPKIRSFQDDYFDGVWDVYDLTQRSDFDYKNGAETRMKQ